MAAMLDVDNLTVRYGETAILENLTFSVERGEWLMIVGPNGAGKSTTISAITQSIPYAGTIRFEGEDLRKKKSTEIAQCIGVLMQKHSAEFAFSVEEVVALGRYCHSPGLLSGKDDSHSDAVEEALKLTGLEELKDRSILTLSGGELQRTFLAQVFAQNPRLLLLDEPTNHLDLIYQKQVFTIISDWLKEPERAVVSVVHDLSLARAYGSKAMLINKGKCEAVGSVKDVLAPSILNPIYGMDVAAWMRQMLSQWET